MIELHQVGVRYPGADHDTLRGVDLAVPDGELVLLTGRTGCGKSTLLGTIDNLVPRFTGGRRSGRIVIDGVDTTTAAPRDLAATVGWVGQDPLAGFVTDTVEDELAYTLEQLGVAPRTIRTRVEQTLDLLGIAELRGRAVRTLSGGQQQRVAIAAVLVADPRVLLLDEPTSALDPIAAEDVIATLHRLVHDLGTTVVLAEHRLERVIDHADSAIRLVAGGGVVHADVATVLGLGLAEEPPLAPPIAQLGHRLGWEPVPLGVRDARRAAAGLRDLLPVPVTGAAVTAPPTAEPCRGDGLRATGVVVRYGSTVAVRDVGLHLAPGEATALLGRNGSGKSSLLWALHGAGPRQAGTVRPDGGRIALVPQTASDLLYLESVAAECDEADRRHRAGRGTTAARLADLAPGIDPRTHPRDLSAGQQLALVLAIQLGAGTEVVLLDEPTRGLDYPAKAALARAVAGLTAAGTAVLVATHDVEFVAQTCVRALLMADGEVVADGTTREVLTDAAMLRTQVARILSPLPYLTVDEVVAARTAEGWS